MYGFNTSAKSLVADSDGKWLDPADPKVLAQAVDGLRATDPAAMAPASSTRSRRSARLSPLPDQVVLVTDGLPTQGAQKPQSRGS